MNIVKEQIDDLNAVVSIELEPKDYADRVEKSIRDHAKKINMPGFRPGKVPTGLVKKMYGRSILADEVNNILSDSLYKYLDEQKIQILGNPLPKEEQDAKNDFDNPGNFKFSYEVGLSPKFDVKLDPKRSFTYEKVGVTDEVIDKEVDALRKRYGKVSSAEKAENEDILAVEISLEGAEGETTLIDSKAATIFLNRSSEEVVSIFKGAGAGDSFTEDLHKIWPENDVLARILGVSEEIAADISKPGKIQVKQIHRLEPADLNEEFFAKIYGPGVVSDEAGLKEKVKGEIENYYGSEADKRFFKTVSDALIKETSIPLPEDFLKRWLRTVIEKPISDHDLDHEFHHYREHVQWELISNRILADQDIAISSDEVKDHVKESLRQRYREYGIQEVPEAELEASARKVLAKRDEARAAYDMLKEQKLLELFKRSFKLEEKELDPETFTKSTK